MVRIFAHAADLLLDEFNFEAVTNDVEIEIAQNLAEVTAFADGDAVFVEGKPSWEMRVNGLWSPTSPAYDGEIFADLTAAARRIGVYPNQYTAGEFGWEGRSNVSQAPSVAPKAGVIALNVTWRGDQPIIRSQSLYVNTAISSTATGTAYEHGSVASTHKVVSIVRLLAAPGGSGSNNLVVTIESDTSGFSSAATRLTFTTINQASVALHEVKEANGAITDTFWRAVATISGGGSRTFNIVIIMGIIPQ
jgi:hypothetical protein